MGAKGIYFLEYRASPPSLASILFYHFASRSTREIGVTSGLPMAWDSGLALSPDGHTLLFAQVDHSGSNLYLAGDFH